MFISNGNEPDIRLEWFGCKNDDQNLRKLYLKWLNDLKIVQPIGSKELLNTNKGCDFIDKSFARFSKSNSIGFFIYYIPDGRYIGTAKLDNISYYSHSAHDGIMIGDSRYHGRGIAEKVYKILLSYAFNKLKMHKIIGVCNIQNTAMVKIFKKIGYILEGRMRDADIMNSEFSDHLYFGILEKEFDSHKVKLIII